MKKKYIFCFDLDNTISKTKGINYRDSIPNKKKIRIINLLFEKGYTIKIFTGRYMGRSKENINIAKKRGYKLTSEQLKRWGLKYHKLILGKPSYDIFFDDKAYGYKNNWISFIIKKYL